MSHAPQEICTFFVTAATWGAPVYLPHRTHGALVPRYAAALSRTPQIPTPRIRPHARRSGGPFKRAPASLSGGCRSGLGARPVAIRSDPPWLKPCLKGRLTHHAKFTPPRRNGGASRGPRPRGASTLQGKRIAARLKPCPDTNPRPSITPALPAPARFPSRLRPSSPSTCAPRLPSFCRRRCRVQ